MQGPFFHPIRFPSGSEVLRPTTFQNAGELEMDRYRPLSTPFGQVSAAELGMDPYRLLSTLSGQAFALLVRCPVSPGK